MKSLSNSSRRKRSFFGDFLNIQKTLIKKINLQTFPTLNIPLLNLDDDIELTILYYIAGYLLCSISKTNTVCNQCLSSAGSTNVLDYKYAKLVQLRCYKENTLFFC